MRKNIFLAFLFLTIPYYIFAQFSLGARITPIFGNGNGLLGDAGNSLDLGGIIPAPNVGVLIKYRFNDMFALQTDINYKIAGINYGGGEHLNFGLEYLEVPLLFQVSGKKKFRGFAEAGLSFGFLLSSTHYHRDGESDTMDYFNSVMVTSDFGGGIMLDIWRFTLFTNIRFGIDLLPVGKNVYDDITNEQWAFDDIHLHHFKWLVGLVYNFNK